MATSPPTFKPFNLALVQLGQVTADKSGKQLYHRHGADTEFTDWTANLKHARDMTLKAAQGGPNAQKPDLIVLPVCSLSIKDSPQC